MRRNKWQKNDSKAIFGQIVIANYSHIKFQNKTIKLWEMKNKLDSVRLHKIQVTKNKTKQNKTNQNYSICQMIKVQTKTEQ